MLFYVRWIIKYTFYLNAHFKYNEKSSSIKRPECYFQICPIPSGHGCTVYVSLSEQMSPACPVHLLRFSPSSTLPARPLFLFTPWMVHSSLYLPQAVYVLKWDFPLSTLERGGEGGLVVRDVSSAGISEEVWLWHADLEPPLPAVEWVWRSDTHSHTHIHTLSHEHRHHADQQTTGAPWVLRTDGFERQMEGKRGKGEEDGD